MEVAVDGGQVVACAAALEQHAAGMGRAAGRLAQAAAVVEWQSPAAQAARDRVDDLVAGLRAGSEQVHDAAVAVRAHGMAVSAAWAELVSTAAAVSEAADQGAEAVRRALRGEVAGPAGLAGISGSAVFGGRDG